MAENVRGQGNRGQNRNLEELNVNPGSRGRSQDSNFNQAGESRDISSSQEIERESQRGMDNRRDSERGSEISRSGRQPMDE